MFDALWLMCSAPGPSGANMDEENIKRAKIIRYRNIRDSQDPFNVSYNEFTHHYRLPQDMVKWLAMKIRLYVEQRSSPLAIPLERKLLCAISFYATGAYQRDVGRMVDHALSKSTVNRALRCKIPNTLGFIDGSLIRIIKPSLEANIQAHIGRTGNTCINAQFVCDKGLKILHVNARFPGSTNDAFVYQNTLVRQRMQELYNERPCYLLGDSGYPQEPFLMTPFARNEAPQDRDSPEARYNRQHCRERNAVERMIGVLKMRWRCINKERVLHYTPVKAGKYTVVASFLHNLARDADLPGYLDIDNPGNADVHVAQDFNNLPAGRMLLLGQQERRRLVQHLDQQRREVN
ncbi:Putative nuclease [Frankliniella fusca]|uniref:Nuclease n=1 Tax=Frankliniella fusca TaxID=407009 RepID=A0AAE1LSH0_9NEOP|nr:Putative nuclease [Frankliniella fusca]